MLLFEVKQVEKLRDHTTISHLKMWRAASQLIISDKFQCIIMVRSLLRVDTGYKHLRRCINWLISFYICIPVLLVAQRLHLHQAYPAVIKITTWWMNFIEQVKQLSMSVERNAQLQQFSPKEWWNKFQLIVEHTRVLKLMQIDLPCHFGDSRKEHILNIQWDSLLWRNWSLHPWFKTITWT